MFILKKKYFLIIESIKDIDLRNIKKHNKFIIIYRNGKNDENPQQLLKFRNRCKLKNIKFFVANNVKLGTFLKSDGIYISSYNKDLKSLNLKKSKFDLIGSAHNHKEIFMKKKQGCSLILLSKLFFVDYKKKEKFLGVIKFNKYLSLYNMRIVPLGGIKVSNLNKLKNINSDGFAVLSEVKKKPAIIDRLF